MIKRNFNGGGTKWPGSSSSTTNTSASDFYGSGGPHGNQSNQAANVINKPTVYVPTGGSDDYGIGSGGEFGGINYGSALPGGGSQEDSYDWRTDSDYGGSTYVPTFGNTIEDFTSAYGGLRYDWVDPNSDFFKFDYKGNPLPDHGEHWYEGGGLWNPFYAGEYPEGHQKEGQPKWLTSSQFNEMMSVGYLSILPPGGSSGGGGTPKYGGDFAGEGLWGQSHIQRKWIEQLRNPHGEGYFRGMNRGGIVSLC